MQVALRYQALSFAGAAKELALVRQFFRRLAGRAKFLPQQRSWRNLARRIFPLQRFQLAFQLPQRKRHVHLRRDKKRLNEKHRADERTARRR